MLLVLKREIGFREVLERSLSGFGFTPGVSLYFIPVTVSWKLAEDLRFLGQTAHSIAGSMSIMFLLVTLMSQLLQGLHGKRRRWMLHIQ